MHKQVWRGSAFDDDDSYISTGVEDGDDSEGSDDDGSLSDDLETTHGGDREKSKKSKRAGLRQEIAELNEKYGLQNEDQTQAQDESLADFYSRTAQYWNKLAAERIAATDAELSNKELKREGFKLAQSRYEEIQPVLERLAKLDLDSSPKQKAETKDKKKKKKKDKK